LAGERSQEREAANEQNYAWCGAIAPVTGRRSSYSIKEAYAILSELSRRLRCMKSAQTLRSLNAVLSWHCIDTHMPDAVDKKEKAESIALSATQKFKSNLRRAFVGR
jgi:hypothetical protein